MRLLLILLQIENLYFRIFSFLFSKINFLRRQFFCVLLSCVCVYVFSRCLSTIRIWELNLWFFSLFLLSLISSTHFPFASFIVCFAGFNFSWFGMAAEKPYLVLNYKEKFELKIKLFISLSVLVVGTFIHTPFFAKHSNEISNINTSRSQQFCICPCCFQCDWRKRFF